MEMKNRSSRHQLNASELTLLIRELTYAYHLELGENDKAYKRIVAKLMHQLKEVDRR